MGADLHDTFKSVRNLYAEADNTLGWSVSDLSFKGPAEKLNDTRYTQPALFVHSVAAGRLLFEEGITPAFAAGHSLGEYSALCLAGAFEFADGLRLVAERARCMADTGKKNPGAMAAVIGLDDEIVEKTIADIDGVVPANYNSPGQIVISGAAEGVRSASDRLSEVGAKRVVPLKVSGAFHSVLMADTTEEFRAAVESAPMKNADIPVIANVTAEPVTLVADIRELLVRQVTSPVRWTQSVQRLAAEGVDTAYEAGPGSVLRGLVRRIERGIGVKPAGTSEDIAALTTE